MSWNCGVIYNLWYVAQHCDFRCTFWLNTDVFSACLMGEWVHPCNFSLTWWLDSLWKTRNVRNEAVTILRMSAQFKCHHYQFDCFQSRGTSSVDVKSLITCKWEVKVDIPQRSERPSSLKSQVFQHWTFVVNGYLSGNRWKLVSEIRHKQSRLLSGSNVGSVR